MIHLHSEIKRLRTSVQEKVPPGEVGKQSWKIVEEVKRLLAKHGVQSDVGNKLQEILAEAHRLFKLTQGKDLFGGKADFSYEKAKMLVGVMERNIGDIGKILKIEFKETQS